jgi:hypothetical protein
VDERFIVLIVASGFLIGLVSIIGGFLQSRRERLLTHQERMKALELGRAVPDDERTRRQKAALGIASSDQEAVATAPSGDERENKDLARKCFSTAFWVGFWGFLAAGGQGGAQRPEVAIAIAIAASAGAIGVTAMICGTVLALRTPSERAPMAVSKPVIDRDAFEVVSHHG